MWVDTLKQGGHSASPGYPMQTEKFQPEGKRLLLETRFAEFPALSVDSRIENSRSASESNV